MIGQNTNVVGVANPMLSEALRASKVRKFSGRAEDFEDFEREWNFHLKLMHQASSGMLPDTVVLMTLKGYLDEASAARLNGRMCIDPDLSYYDFWDEMKITFVSDARNIHRQQWRGVKLISIGNRVTLQEWATFNAQYVAIYMWLKGISWRIGLMPRTNNWSSAKSPAGSKLNVWQKPEKGGGTRNG